MNVLFDGDILNHPQWGMTKSLLYLYEHCHRLDPNFHALGFGYQGDDCLRHSDKGIALMGVCSCRDLDAIVAGGGFDVLHFPANFTRLRRIKGIPHMLTLHDIIPHDTGFFGWRADKKLRYEIRTRLSPACGGNYYPIPLRKGFDRALCRE